MPHKSLCVGCLPAANEVKGIVRPVNYKHAVAYPLQIPVRFSNPLPSLPPLPHTQSTWFSYCTTDFNLYFLTCATNLVSDFININISSTPLHISSQPNYSPALFFTHLKLTFASPFISSFHHHAHSTSSSSSSKSC